MKKLVTVVGLVMIGLGSTQASANSGDCLAIQQSMYTALARNSAALLDKLLAEGKISDNDLTEYDRIQKPTKDAINTLKATCDLLDAEQRTAFTQVFTK